MRVEPELHAEVSRYIQERGMTMSEFVTQALENELHSKIQMKEGNNVETKTIAFQVPEDLYLRIKDYLQRNDLTQKQFFINLIEDELEREQTELASRNVDMNGSDPNTEDTENFEDPADAPDEDEDYGEDESEDEDEGFALGM